MLIRSCAFIRQLCQYICLIWNHCNQQFGQQHWFTCISHYWHMTLNNYVCQIAQIFYCGLHKDSTLLHISIKINELQQLFTILLQSMCQQQICPSKVKNWAYSQIIWHAFVTEVCQSTCHLWSCSCLRFFGMTGFDLGLVLELRCMPLSYNKYFWGFTSLC